MLSTAQVAKLSSWLMLICKIRKRTKNNKLIQKATVVNVNENIISSFRYIYHAYGETSYNLQLSYKKKIIDIIIITDKISLSWKSKRKKLQLTFKEMIFRFLYKTVSRKPFFQVRNDT